MFTLLAIVGATACGPAAVRLAGPVPTYAPPPKTTCEREHSYELVPSELHVHATETGFLLNRHFWKKMKGLAVYRHGSEDPEELDELWSKMGEPALQRQHQARIQPVDDAHLRSLYWSLGALAVMGTGLGTAAAIHEQSSTGAAVAGFGGLALGLTGAIVAVASQPSGPEQLEAGGRRYLFVRGEDDDVAVARGVGRLTLRARRQCR